MLRTSVVGTDKMLGTSVVDKDETRVYSPYSFSRSLTVFEIISKRKRHSCCAKRAVHNLLFSLYNCPQMDSCVSRMTGCQLDDFRLIPRNNGNCFVTTTCRLDMDGFCSASYLLGAGN